MHPGLSPRPLHVLLVDDDRDTTASLALLLGLWGHDTLEVHDGPAALAAAPAYRPDVILLDLGLPGMDGYEVARRLREHPALGKALLVAATGYGREEDRRRCREAGFDLHLLKPLDPDHLRELLAGVRPARADRPHGRCGPRMCLGLGVGWPGPDGP